MKLAVIGSRGFNNYELLKYYLDKINSIKPITQIVSGGAYGADNLGEKWAKENKIETNIIYPNWKLFGKKAGFLRNQTIINECDNVIAFWDGESKGTKNSIDLANKCNKRCKIITYL